jgi:uncharacterized protein YbgA (DUF1722 family)/uncharacterized protein YbbK (DUF523 family)
LFPFAPEKTFRTPENTNGQELREGSSSTCYALASEMSEPQTQVLDPVVDLAKPIVVVSQCLGFAAVRYNGQVLQDDFVRALTEHVRFVQVCPEVGIGLGVPRDPIRIVVDKAGRHLVQPTTGRDLTTLMREFGNGFLNGLGSVDGFILKSRSPSCGIKDVKTFKPNGNPDEKSAGLFAEIVLRRFPRAAIEDEGRLTNCRLRHHFLIKLFASARLRSIRHGGTLSDLVRFHTRYKLQWMAYSQRGLNRLGRIVANPDCAVGDAIFESYAEVLSQILAHPARSSGIRNALMHAFGYVSKQLNSSERKYFLDLLEQYRSERLPLSALLTVLRSWVLRFDTVYLADQYFFQPYPAGLDLASFSRSRREID